MMTNVLLPFLMSMFLGRTIDLRSYDIGMDMFDSEQYDEVTLNLGNSTYTVLQSNELPYSFMGLPVDIALRIKSGILSASSGHEGLNGLLGDATWKQRSVTVAVASGVQTIQRTLKEDAKPIKNWSSRITKSQTHYTNSLVYGGWSFILYTFKCDIPGDVEIVRNILTKSLGMYGTVNKDITTKWENAVEEIRRNHEVRGEVNVQVHTYSSFHHKNDVSSPESLLNFIGEMPKLIGPKGRPVYMELVPLHSLDDSYPAVHENHTLDSELEKIDSMYDDVRNTKNSLNRWVEETEANFSEEDEQKISDLVDHLSSCSKLFHKVASEASVYKNMDQNLLKSAVNLYNKDLTNYAYSYDRLFRILKEEITADCQNTFHHKIKGLLQVDDTERIYVGEVTGGLEECKEACLAASQCRSVGFIDKMMYLKKIPDGSRSIYKMVHEENICYVYFRSSSSADVVPPTGATVVHVYDRVCK